MLVVAARRFLIRVLLPMWLLVLKLFRLIRLVSILMRWLWCRPVKGSSVTKRRRLAIRPMLATGMLLIPSTVASCRLTMIGLVLATSKLRLLTLRRVRLKLCMCATVLRILNLRVVRLVVMRKLKWLLFRLNVLLTCEPFLT